MYILPVDNIQRVSQAVPLPTFIREILFRNSVETSSSLMSFIGFLSLRRKNYGVLLQVKKLLLIFKSFRICEPLVIL
jgi:hypothetical protein